MKDIRVLINASPRSGHTWMQYLLLKSIDFNKSISMGEIEDKFIIRTNAPVILLGQFPDIIQATVIRNPIDIIPSIITKTMGGIGNTVASNIPMPHEYNNLPSLSQFVDDQFDVYRRWSGSTIKNIDNLYAVTFEQMTNNPEFVVDYVMSNFESGYNKLSNSRLQEFEKESRRIINQHDKGDPAFNNPLPVDKKPEVYYEIKELVESHPRLQEALNLFDLANKTIIDSQERKLNA
jgi:hypothetical protein